MDLWSVHVKSTSNSGPFLLRNSIPEKPFSAWTSKTMLAAVAGGSSSSCWRVFGIRVSKRKPYGGHNHQSFMVRAMGKKNNSSNDNSSSSSDEK